MAVVDAKIVGVDPGLQPLRILPPIVVGVGDILIPLGVSAHGRIEIGQIARIGEYRYEEYPASEEKDESSHDAPGSVIAVVALPIVEHGFGSEDVEERKDWEEMSEADIEISGNTEITVERNKSEHGVLRNMRLE